MRANVAVSSRNCDFSRAVFIKDVQVRSRALARWHATIASDWKIEPPFDAILVLLLNALVFENTCRFAAQLRDARRQQAEAAAQAAAGQAEASRLKAALREAQAEAGRRAAESAELHRRLGCSEAVASGLQSQVCKRTAACSVLSFPCSL